MKWSIKIAKWLVRQGWHDAGRQKRHTLLLAVRYWIQRKEFARREPAMFEHQILNLADGMR